MKKKIKLIVILILLLLIGLSYLFLNNYLKKDKLDINYIATVDSKKEFFKGKFNPQIIDYLEGDKYEDLMYDLLIKIIFFRENTDNNIKKKTYFEISNYVKIHIDEFLNMIFEKKGNKKLSSIPMIFFNDIDTNLYVEKQIDENRVSMLYFHFFNYKLIFSNIDTIKDVKNDIKISKTIKNGKIKLTYSGLSEKGKKILKKFNETKKRENLYFNKQSIFFPINDSFTESEILELAIDNNFNFLLDLYSNGKNF